MWLCESDVADLAMPNLVPNLVQDLALRCFGTRYQTTGEDKSATLAKF